MKSTYNPNSSLDLSFTRSIEISKSLIWRAWTEPELLMPWFCPLPWKTIDCEIDLRVGGAFRTTMLSPEGEQFPNCGCYLEIINEERLVWTNALEPGFRPSAISTSRDKQDSTFRFTAMIELEDCEGGTHYRATVLHGNEDDCKKHSEMGFEHGWSTALDQMIKFIHAGGVK